MRAPFSGRLGVRQVNLGQLLGQGDPIVTLQALDPIFVDFSLPQQQLAQLQARPAGAGDLRRPARGRSGGTHHRHQPPGGQRHPQRQDPGHRANRSENLRPGMFVNVAVGLPAPLEVLAIPATAVLYAPYSDSVFVIETRPGRKGPGQAAPAVRAPGREAWRLRGRRQRAQGRAKGWSARGSSSCATARRRWWTTTLRRPSSSHPSRRTTDRMNFTDLFIRRPVLALVVNLVILIAGLQAIRSLNVRQYPRSENATVTVTTVYVGASADLVRGFVTTPLERAIAAADGIDYMRIAAARWACPPSPSASSSTTTPTRRWPRSAPRWTRCATTCRRRPRCPSSTSNPPTRSSPRPT